MILPWCLLVTALSLPEISMQTRIELLEIGFWMLPLDAELVEPGESDLDRPPWPALLPSHAKKQASSLCTSIQIWDAVNTFLALIVIVCDSDQPFSLHRVASNPLEQAFGSGCIECRDVHTTERFLEAFASSLTSGGAKQLLEIAARPRRRCSVGVNYAPLTRNQDSILRSARWSSPGHYLCELSPYRFRWNYSIPTISRHALGSNSGVPRNSFAR
jgi:hypothetical protein